jgi:hypothetical protein
MTDTELTGLTNLGTLGASTPSGGYTVVDDTVDHNFRLEDGTLAGGSVEYQLNSITGSWTTLITAGGTTGTIAAASLSPSDVIFFRHLDNSDNGDNVMFFGAEDGSPDTDKLYAVLTDDAEWDTLMGYWSCDEVSTGAGLVDRVARYATGTPDLVDEDNVTSIAGQVNFSNAARIRDNAGTLEHLRIANADAEPRIIPTGVFTLLAWVYIEAGGLDDTFRSFFSCLDLDNGSPSFTDRVFHLSVNSTEQLSAAVHDSTGDFGGGSGARSDAGDIVEEEWMHIGLAFDGTNYRVYFNGTVGTTVSNAIGSTLNSTGQDFVVGGADRGGTGAANVDLTASMIDCRFDEIRMYHRELSAAEISEIASRDRPV